MTPGMPSTLALIALSAIVGILLHCWDGAGVTSIMGIMITAFAAKDYSLFMGRWSSRLSSCWGRRQFETDGRSQAYREGSRSAARAAEEIQALTMLLPILMAALSAAAGSVSW